MESFSWISPSVNLGGWDAVVSPGCRCVCFVDGIGMVNQFQQRNEGAKNIFMKTMIPTNIY